MTKNKKTILLTLLACLVLFIAADLGGVRLRFGTAYINDTTASSVSLNKGIIVNGRIGATDSIDAGSMLRADELEFDGASPTILFKTYGMYIEGGLDALGYYANTHNFLNERGTSTLLTMDSTEGVGIRINNAGVWEGSLLKTKLIRTVAPTGNFTVTVAHGITDGRIVAANIWLRHDTTYTTAYHTAANWYVQPGASYDPTISYYGGYDGTYCWARFPAAATATRGDSLYFLLSYFD